jgi:hypothetical protein
MKLKLSFGNAGAQWGVFVLCLLGFTSFPASAAKYPDAVLADGPIAFWSFSETNLSSSTTDFATNSGATGLNFNGTYLNGVTHPVAGALVGSPETVVERLAPSEPVSRIFAAPTAVPKYSHHSFAGVPLADQEKVCVLPLSAAAGAGLLTAGNAACACTGANRAQKQHIVRTHCCTFDM